MANFVWSWGGGTFCTLPFGKDNYVAVLMGEAVLFSKKGRAMYVGFGYHPKDVRLFRGQGNYAPMHTGVVIKELGLGVDHVLTLQEFAQVASAWRYAKEQGEIPAQREDAEKVQQGISVGDRILQVAEEYFYHV